MGLVVSVFLEHLEFLGSYADNIGINGAVLATSDILRHIAAMGGVDRMEFFIPSSAMLPQQRLQQYAAKLGRIQFFPYHAAEKVWADGQPRILFTYDVGGIVRDRYLRDRFAAGPMPISVD